MGLDNRHRMPDWESRLQGLKLQLKLGDIVVVNGELLIQVRKARKDLIELCIDGDKDKYQVSRRHRVPRARDE